MTGAGRGLGRAYACELARRGARVVVNDLGTAVDGAGADAGPASAVAREITDAGGEAVADAGDVSSPADAQALVGAALERFGRVDVVVNNAGIVRFGALCEADPADLDRHLAVHARGAFNVTRAAWPHLVAQGYGRVVMTTSTGVLGLPDNVAYAAAKGAVIGLARSLATAGAAHGIAVNCIAPAAATRMGGRIGTPELAPELVAPMVAYLAHESCAVTGEVYVAGAGRFARLFVATTDGWLCSGRTPTAEDVVANWATINDEAGYHVPADLGDWSARFTRHLGR
ncbi:MAG: short-chain dehydrogenase [Acidimicrobiia bacterium]|nr:MAG: short-chain dehydrogenase [Acidimicrobiia bacterium]